jgi:hypothetical protein
MQQVKSGGGRLRRPADAREDEFDAELGRPAPDHAAIFLELVPFEEKQELVGNTQGSCHLKAGADGREIAHAAFDRAGMVERDQARLERAVTELLAAFDINHRGLLKLPAQCPPDMPPESTQPRQYTHYGLSGRENDLENLEHLEKLS